MNGSQMERELMKTLRYHGFVTMRAPGSGTGDFDLPDVLAAKNGIAMAAEVKSGDRPSNLTNAEVEALATVGDAFLGASLVAVRYKQDRTFYLADVAALEETDAGNYSVPVKENLPWTAAIHYQEVDGEIVPDTNEGQRGVEYANDEVPPTLQDFFDALVTSQQGYQVRNGVVDLTDQDHDSAACGGGDDGE